MWKNCCFWALFALAVFQGGFLHPRLLVMPREPRVKLGFTLVHLAALAFAAAALGWDRFSRTELCCIAFFAIAIFLSGVFSLTPLHSLLRGFTIVASAAAGFGTARIVFQSRSARNRLMLIFMSAIALRLFAGFASCCAKRAISIPWENRHAVLGFMVICSFSLWEGVLAGGSLRTVSVLLLVVFFAFSFLLQIKSVLVVIALMALTYIVLNALDLKWVVVTALCLLLAGGVFVYSLSHRKMVQDIESVRYRLEAVPFSLHVWSVHPFFGSGLWTPKLAFTENYSTFLMSRKRFLYYVKSVRTADILYLSILAELGGLVFAAYCLLAVRFFLSLARLVRRDRTMVPLLLVFCASHLHFFTYDGLYHPQIAWVFFIVIGLIPRSFPADASCRKPAC